jgi:hypothetical protein
VATGQAGGAGQAGAGGAAVDDGCDLAKPFGKPGLLFKANATQRASGRFWPDERSIFFVADNDIYRAERASTLVAFPDGSALKNVNTAGLEYAPFISRDGKSLYLNSSSQGVLKLATRTDVGGDFGVPDDVAGLKPYPDAPYLAGNDDVLYYDADDDQLVKHHIWRAALTQNGFANNEIQVADDAALRPSSPVVTRDELAIYFSGTTPKETSVYLATRDDPTAAFGKPQLVSELSVDMVLDRPTWLSEDRCRIVVQSGDSLYLALKTK